MNKNEEKLWIYDPKILLNRNNIMKLRFEESDSLETKVNIASRLTILGIFVLYVLFGRMKLVYLGITLITIFVVGYHILKRMREKEGFQPSIENPQTLEMHDIKPTQAPSQKNPLMNVTMDEYKYNPKRNGAKMAYETDVMEEINKNVKKNINPNLFRNIGDEIDFDVSMRQFYSTANTTIPNDSIAFANYCYGNMPSCKDGDVIQCEKNNFRHVLR